MLIIRCFLLFFSSLILLYQCSAQVKHVSGLITDSLQKPVPFVSVVAYDLRQDTVFLTFTQTNVKGYFTLSIPDSIQKVHLRISLLGYQEVWKSVMLNARENVLPEPIVLFSVDVQFQDVFIVDKQTFNASGDTLNINANAFKDSTEKNIEDLLKKIPGFNVDEKGKITFKGKEIQRITIEGDDITKQNYQIISRNFSARPVQDIQVISNYSENPLLAGIHGQHKETVLNLKLDGKHKNTWSKQIDLYAAYPYLYDIYANVGVISKTLKTINFVDANTMSKDYIGGSISLLLPPQGTLFSDFIQQNSYEMHLYQVPISDIEPFLYQNHTGYCVNTSANYKFNPKTTLKWTGFLNTYHQNIKESESIQNIAIFIYGRRNVYQLQKKFFGDIEFSFFPNKKHFFSHTSTFTHSQNDENSHQNTNIFNNQSGIHTDNLFQFHKTTYTHKIGHKYILAHRIQYRHNNQKSYFDLYQSPAQKFPLINLHTDTIQEFLSVPSQNIRYESDLFTRKLRYSVGYDYLLQSMQSYIQTLPHFSVPLDSFANQSKYSLQSLCFSTFKETKWRKFRLSTELKPYFMQWKHLSFDTISKIKTVYTLLPNIKLGYKSFLVGYQYQIMPTPLYNLYSGYIFTQNRSLRRGANNLYPMRTHTGIISYSYNHLPKGFMLHSYVSYAMQQGLISTYTEIDSIYTISQVHSEPTTLSQLLFQSMVSKVFFKHRWSINLFIFGFQNEVKNLLYGIPLNTTQRLVSAHLRVSLLPRKVFYFGAGTKMQYLHTVNTVMDLPIRLSQYAYQMSPYVESHIRYKQWTFSVRGLYFLNYNNHFNTPFLLPWMQTECRYQPSQKKYSFNVKCENLFNHKQWQTNTIDVFSNQQNFIPIRGRVFMVNFTYTL